jgi:hypothetical protein
VIPLDILPYFFALEPSPSTVRNALAVARPVAGGSDVAVSLVLEDAHQCLEIFRFGRLGLVKMAWSRCGRQLACAQNCTLITHDSSGSLQLHSLAENVQWLGFDGKQQLWCLAGKQLDVRCDGRVTASIDRVENAAVSECAAYCCCEDTRVFLYLNDGGTRRMACLSDGVEPPTVRLSLREPYLVAALLCTAVRDRARVRVVRFDIRTSGMDVLLDQEVGIGFNAGPGLTAVPLESGEVLATYEHGSCTRLWTLSPQASAEPISPEGFEVFDFAVNAAGDRVAIIASDTRSALGASQRHLVLLDRQPTGWAVRATVPGVFDMPRWRHDNALELLCGDHGRWTRCTLGSASETTSGSPSFEATSVATRLVQYDVVRLAGPRQRPAGIVLLPRVHQQFVAGAQSFFFHHLLFSVARHLAARRYTVVTLTGPGAIGRGRARRELAGGDGSYFAQVRSAIHDVVQSLRAEGCQSVGIMAGSLAAVPVLRAIGSGTPLTAAAFVAPLFDASIPLTRPLGYHLVDDPLVEPLEQAAAKVEIPSLVIHGVLDEVVPLEQIKLFCTRARDRDLVELCLFESEGHIFKEVESWRRTQSTIEAFFALHLTAGASSSTCVV